MPYLTSEIKVGVLTSGLATVIFAICLGLSSFGIHEVSKMSFKIDRVCKDTNCTVNVIDGNCFARYVEFSDDGSEFVKLKCDKHRKGTYEVILPCDVTKNGKPRINCDVHNSDVIAGFVILIISIIVFSALFCFSFAGICLMCSIAIDSIVKEKRDIKYRKERKEEMEQTNKSSNDKKILEEIVLSKKTQQEEKRPHDDLEVTLPQNDNQINSQAKSNDKHDVSTNYGDLHANCTNVFSGGFNEKIHSGAPEMLQNTTHDLNSGFENAEHTFGFD